MQTFIYSYGALAPDGAALVWEQVRNGHKYYNSLVENERVRRAAVEKLLQESNAQIKVIFEQIAELNEEQHEKVIALGDVKRKERDGHPLAEEIEALKDDKKKLYDKLKVLRKEFWDNEITPYNEKFDKLKCNAFWAKIDDDELRQKIDAIKDEKERRAKEKKIFKAVGPHTRTPLLEELTQQALNDPSFGQMWKQYKTAEHDALVASKQLRAQSGCFSGTYAHVENAALVSFQKSIRLPRFRSFDGRGAVGLQLNGNVVTTESALSGEDDRLQIRLTGAQLRNMATNERRGTPRVAAEARIRLAKGKHITVPFVMHRPLPDGAKITWIKLFVKRIGLRNFWELQFTLNSESPRVMRNPKHERIAVNLGWRTLPDGSVRVATTWDGSNSESIILTPKMRSENERIESLISYSDNHFLDAKANLSRWKKGRKLPEEVDVIFNGSHAWKAHGKLAVAATKLLPIYASNIDKKLLWKKWKKARLPKHDLFDSYDVITKWLSKQGVQNKDAQFVLYLDWWRAKDAHLINYARGIQARLRLHRREIYRRAVAHWSRNYQTITIEDWNKSKTARKPRPEKDTRSEQEIKSNSIRQFCGVSVLTQAIELAFSKSHVKKQKASGITLNHHNCQGVGDNALQGVHVLCSHCHVLFDQDVNAAKHLYDGESFGRSQRKLTSSKCKTGKNEGKSTAKKTCTNKSKDNRSQTSV